MAEEGPGAPRRVRIIPSANVACFGVGLVFLHQGNVHRAVPVLERAMELCRTDILRSSCPGRLVPWG